MEEIELTLISACNYSYNDNDEKFENRFSQSTLVPRYICKITAKEIYQNLRYTKTNYKKYPYLLL